MSLWRVKHTLTPFVEHALVLLAACYGAAAIYFASLHPLVVATTADIRSVPPPIGLDTDAWPRYENVPRGYQFALPPEWRVDERDPNRVTAAYGATGARGLADPRRFEIEVVDLSERQEAENVAAGEFVGQRPALYDVGVYGKSGLFAVAFADGRVVNQVVYVPIGRSLYVFRGGSVDPAVFAAFVSSVKFFPELQREPVTEIIPAPL
jgi:hypothetical protein